MSVLTRKKILGAIAHAIVILLLMPGSFSAASDRFKVDHPLMPPSPQFSGQCPLCGMVRSMWARTWIEFDRTDGVSEVCSFHCLADFTRKSGVLPKNISLAVYHAPKKMIDSAAAVIVIGSNAKGTMTPRSKIVFADSPQAKAFVSTHGGETASFTTALDVAQAGVSGENTMLVKKRLKKGKIVEPGTEDRCAVCEMYPSRYPKNKCQIHGKDGKIYHFCSTQCMFTFLNEPEPYAKPDFSPQLIWVIEFNSGRWISGRSAYYIVGAKDVYGPMGFEALPFDKKSDADSFAGPNGANTLLFGEVTPEKIFNR
jgi:nitrous oxide reductase accessory protein NosL